MKKILFLSAIALATISCQDEESNLQVNQPLPQSNKVQVVQITNQGEIIPLGNSKTRSLTEGETALQFASEADYQLALAEIDKLNTKERRAFVDSKNFTSLQELAVKADEELDEIGEAATSESDFRMKYAQYVEKYSKKLITNQYDSEDLTLYVPNGDNLSTYFINENQKVVIGNQIKSITLNNDMSTSDKILFAATPRAGETNRYTFKTIVGKKKTTGSVTIETSSGISVHVGCQKKLWYGWRRDDHRDIYFQISAPSSQMYYTFPNNDGNPQRTNYIQYFAFHDNGDLNHFVGGLQPGIKLLTGTLSVWTDMTADTKNLIEYKTVFARYEGKFGVLGTHKLPKLDAAKAYGGKFTITKTL